MRTYRRSMQYHYIASAGSGEGLQACVRSLDGHSGLRLWLPTSD